MTGAEIAIIGLAVAGTSVAAYGQYQSGKNAQSQAKAQSAFNLYNSKLKLREKEAQDKANAFASAQSKKRAEAFQARFRSKRGGAGVGKEGSPLLIAENNAALFATEATNIRLTGERKSSTLKSQSILDVSMASAARSRASGFGRAAGIGAGATLLQGFAGAAFMASGGDTGDTGE